VRELYAPLWNAYAWDGTLATPRVSLGWGAVTRDGAETAYPWRFDPSDPPATTAPPDPPATTAE
jgi:hypothetical protein